MVEDRSGIPRLDLGVPMFRVIGVLIKVHMFMMFLVQPCQVGKNFLTFINLSKTRKLLFLDFSHLLTHFGLRSTGWKIFSPKIIQLNYPEIERGFNGVSANLDPF